MLYYYNAWKAIFVYKSVKSILSAVFSIFQYLGNSWLPPIASDVCIVVCYGIPNGNYKSIYCMDLAYNFLQRIQVSLVG